MRITETIRNSTSAIRNRRTARENKKSAEDYRKALERLEQAGNALKSVLDCAAALKTSGVVGEPLMPRQMRDELVEYADSCGRGLYEGTLTLDMVTAFRTKGEAAAGQMEIAWKDAAARYAEGTNGYLSMIGSLTDDPKHARELADNISKTVDGPLSVAAVKKLVSAVAEARKITDAFSLSPEIEAFLKKVSLQQATAADLTPDILKWLQEKKLTGKLKIRF